MSPRTSILLTESLTLFSVDANSQEWHCSDKCLFHVVSVGYGKEVAISRVGVRDGEGHVGRKIMGFSDQSMQLLKLVQLRTIQTEPSELTLKLDRERDRERQRETNRETEQRDSDRKTAREKIVR